MSVEQVHQENSRKRPHAKVKEKEKGGSLCKRFEAWVRHSLIQTLVPPDSVVCDVSAGKLGDLPQLQKVSIAKLIALDFDASHIKEAGKRWMDRGQPFPATFLQFDIFKQDLVEEPAGILAQHRGHVDVAICQGRLHHAFSTEERARRFLSSVSLLLKPGGFFFGFTFDSSSLWAKTMRVLEMKKADKSGRVKISGGADFTIDIHPSAFDSEVGGKFKLFCPSAPEKVSSCSIVHFPTLIAIAESKNLRLRDASNFVDFYHEHRFPFKSSLKNMHLYESDALKPKTQEVEILGLFTTFVFQKCNEAAVGGVQEEPIGSDELLTRTQATSTDATDVEMEDDL